jgi:hypothetical protein
MEGNIYRIKKSIRGGKVHLSVIGKPKLSVKGDDDEDALESLEDKIIETYGDGEPKFEFEPQKSDDEGAFKLSANEKAKVLNEAEILGDNSCKHCRVIMGGLPSDPKIELVDKSRSDLMFCTIGGEIYPLLSKKLCSHLVAHGLKVTAFQAVINPAGKEYFVPIKAARSIDWAEPRPANNIKGAAFRCPKCSHTSYFYYDNVAKARKFISGDLWNRLKKKCVIAGQFSTSVVVSAQIRSKIMEGPNLGNGWLATSEMSGAI